MELDDVLNGPPSAAPEPAPMPEPAPEPSPPGEPPAEPPAREQPRDPHGRFAPKQEPGPEPAPPAGRQDTGPIPIQALLDEREKRQALQRERDDYARRVQEYERRLQTPPPQRPSVLENPDGALDYVEQRYEQRLMNTKLDMSVTMAQGQWPDYAEKEAAFIQAARQYPELAERMRADPHPAGFAYRVGAQVLASRDIGDPTTYRDRLAAELREQVRAELLAEMGQQSAPAPAPAFPTPLSTARSAAPRQPTQAYTGDVPLSALGNPGLRMG